MVSDKVVSEVVSRTAAGTVTPIITTGSVKRMNLKEGSDNQGHQTLPRKGTAPSR